jgi:hypothetical protein
MTQRGLPWAAALGLVVCVTANLGTAVQTRAQPHSEYYESSLLAWIDAVAAAVEQRVTAAGAAMLSLDVRGGRGVEDRKAGRVFQRGLERRLDERGTHTVTRLGAPGSVHTRIELSLEGSRLWAVGLVEGGSVPLALAVSWPIDRELEALLVSGGARAGQARWSMQRLGTVPAGVLDVVLSDLDGDGGDEIILLSTDGVRTLRFRGSDARPESIGGPWPLPGGGPWPRVVAGWMAPDGGSSVRIATTAGHGASLDAATGRWETVDDPALVPLRQAPAEAHAPWRGGLRAGSGPDLAGPSMDSALPPRVRDAVLLPIGAWLWVDRDGRLGAAYTPDVSLPAGRFGDRFVLADLDRDGALDLITTTAAPAGEPDEVTIHRLDPLLQGHSVLFSAQLEGSIVALAVGDLDFDGQPDLLLVEEGRDLDAVLWRVERSW